MNSVLWSVVQSVIKMPPLRLLPPGSFVTEFSRQDFCSVYCHFSLGIFSTQGIKPAYFHLTCIGSWIFTTAHLLEAHSLNTCCPYWPERDLVYVPVSSTFRILSNIFIILIIGLPVIHCKSLSGYSI